MLFPQRPCAWSVRRRKNVDTSLTNTIISQPAILYEDNELLVIDKPCGVVVNRAESVKEQTVADWARGKFEANSSRLTDRESDYYKRSGVVHRLDKETSGCLIIAKTPEAFQKLQAAFKERKIKKTYVALVHGKIPESGEINAPVDRLPWNRERFGIVPGGKEAVTRYRVTKNYELKTKNKIEYLSLVEVCPESGRTHQIRVHLKYLGFPIVGDYLYAGRKTQRADRQWCPRVFLHAAEIEFPHPGSASFVKVKAPLPEELVFVLAKLSRKIRI